MNTYACFVFLLAIGLSAQLSEFDIDFKNMVNTVTLENKRTLLDCTENCDEVTEAKCECLRFTCPVKIKFIECIKGGLRKLNLTQTEDIIDRLQSELDLKSETKRVQRNKKLARTMSPKCFLNYIVELYQEANAEKYLNLGSA